MGMVGLSRPLTQLIAGDCRQVSRSCDRNCGCPLAAPSCKARCKGVPL